MSLYCVTLEAQGRMNSRLAAVEMFARSSLNGCTFLTLRESARHAHSRWLEWQAARREPIPFGCRWPHQGRRRCNRPMYPGSAVAAPCY